MSIVMSDNYIRKMTVHQQGSRADKTDDPASRPCAQTENDSTSTNLPDQELFYQGKTGKPRVLVIANSTFQQSKELRGHRQDKKALKKMWKNEFQCLVFEEKNLTTEEIITEIQGFSDGMTGDERYCAVFILSHGKCGDLIVGTDEETVPFDDILSIFDNRNEKLRGIPKLFFFQCCRGDMVDRGVPASVSAATGMRQGSTLPEVSDTLIMFASQRDKISIVDDNGSWIVKELIDVFRNYHQQQDLTSMLTIVNKRISEKEVKRAPGDPDIVGAKCMSEYRSTLTAKLSLTPT